MNSNLKVIEPQAVEAATTWELDAQRVDLIKQSIMRGASPLELGLFLDLCRAKRLDPLTKQIYAIKTSQGWQYFASIDGLRVIAQRSGEYAGQVGPEWFGPDGEWVDVWLQPQSPAAARVGVLRRGWSTPMWGVATFKSYGKQSPIWGKMADVMLAKCAESVALRKAFPDDLSGLYVREEFRDTDEMADDDGYAPVSEIPGGRSDEGANSRNSGNSTTSPTLGAKIRPAQVKRIQALCDELGYDLLGRKQIIASEVGTSDFNKMSERDGQRVIALLEGDATAAEQESIDQETG